MAYDRLFVNVLQGVLLTLFKMLKILNNVFIWGSLVPDYLLQTVSILSNSNFNWP